MWVFWNIPKSEYLCFGGSLFRLWNSMTSYTSMTSCGFNSIYVKLMQTISWLKTIHTGTQHKHTHMYHSSAYFYSFIFIFYANFQWCSLIWRNSHAKRLHQRTRRNIEVEWEQSKNKTKIGSNQILKTKACAQRKHCCDSNGFFAIALSIGAWFCFWIDEFELPKKYTHICPPQSLALCHSCFPFFVRC